MLRGITHQSGQQQAMTWISGGLRERPIPCRCKLPKPAKGQEIIAESVWECLACGAKYQWTDHIRACQFLSGFRWVRLSPTAEPSSSDSVTDPEEKPAL
jgi:hypothetical protein